MISTKTSPSARNLDNVFSDFFNSLPTAWPTESKVNTAPVNIMESESGYHLEFNVPGRSKENFTINIEQNLLTVSFENAEQAAQTNLKFVRREFSFPSFKRSFTLDEKIKTDGIEAKYENGILKIYLPKKEEVKIEQKQIIIQ